jgi:hypothetical protein
MFQVFGQNLLKLLMCALSILMTFNKRKVAKWSLFQPKFFPRIYIVYHSDRGCHTKLHGRGALIDVSESDFGIKRRSDLEYFQEGVWVEITVINGCNLLIGNHYFTPNIMVDIKNCLNVFENILKTLNYHVLLGDFNDPGFNWN